MGMLQLFCHFSLLFCHFSLLVSRFLGPKRNSLPGLPVQILFRITEFLSRDDITCTSLCNHRLFALLKSREPPSLRTRRDKLTLLTRLGRDLPNFFACHACHVLHRHDTSTNFLPGPRFNICARCPRESLRLYLPFNQLWYSGHSCAYLFHFTHLQLLMMRLYLGPEYGIGTEDISYTEVQVHSLQPATQVSLISSVDADICSTNPNLILRVQQIISVDRHKRYLLYRCPRPSLKKIIIPPQMITICRHETNQEIDTWVNQVVSAHRAGEKAPSVSFACRHCDTEALLEMVEFDNQLALVITKWIGLGAGLTPEDPQWRNHQEFGVSPMRSTEGEYTKSSAKASARACFERASTESLRSRNMAYLKDQRFKKCMIHDPLSQFGDYDPDTWYLWGNHSRNGRPFTQLSATQFLDALSSL